MNKIMIAIANAFETLAANGALQRVEREAILAPAKLIRELAAEIEKEGESEEPSVEDRGEETQSGEA